MAEDYIARLDISPEKVNIDVAKREAKDLAWEHAKDFAAAAGFAMGSDEFVDIYSNLDERYEHSVEHLKLFMLTALITVRELLENNLVELPLDKEDGPLAEEELAKAITDIAQCIVGSFMWLSSSHETYWPTDESITEEYAVSFHFDPEDVYIEEEY